MIPGVDLCLLMLELPLEILKGNQIIQRMNVTGDRLCDCPNLGAADGVCRQQRGLRMCLIDVFDDGHRLSKHLAAGQHQNGHPLCGLMVRYSGVCCRPPSFVRWMGTIS